MSAQQQSLPSSNEIYKKISKFIPDAEWKIHAPLIEKINRLKKEKNKVKSKQKEKQLLIVLSYATYLNTVTSTIPAQ